jgi:uncharacterized protein (TIGR03546 family)
MALWFLKQIHALIKSLHSHESPNQLAAGFVVGSFIGWMPFNILITPFFFILLYMLNVNAGFGLLGAAIITLFSFLIDPFAGYIGEWLLNHAALQPLWTMLYNIPIVPYTSFNNTVMLGSLVMAILLAVPLFFLIRWGVIRYRLSWQARVETWKIVRIIQTSKAVGWWMKVKNL